MFNQKDVVLQHTDAQVEKGLMLENQPDHEPNFESFL